MRRLLSAIVLLALATGIVWTLYTWRGPARTAVDPWQAIPVQSAIVVSMPDAIATWDKAAHTAQLWRVLEQLPGAAAAGRLLSTTRTRMENDAALRLSLEGAPALMALMRASSDRLGWLLVVSPNNGSIPAQALAELLGSDDATAKSIEAGRTVVVQPDTALPDLSLCIHKGLWLLASAPEVLEEALLQLKSDSPITSDPVFADALRTRGGGTEAHVLVHATRALRLLNIWWTPASVERMDLPAGWAALDVRIRPDALLLGGLFFPEESHPALTALAAQGSGANSLLRMLPASVSSMQWYHITDATRWLADRRAGQEVDERLATALFHWVDGAMGMATAAAENGGAPARWALFSTSDSTAAVEALRALCPEGCDSLLYRGHRLLRLPNASLHDRLLGRPYDLLERPWWTLLGDVVIFSDDTRNLMASIDVWNDGRSLAEDARTNAWQARISATAGYTFWCDVARSQTLLASLQKPASTGGTSLSDSVWNSMGGLSVQVSPGQRGHFHLTIGLQHAPLEQRVSGTLWSTAIGEPLVGVPQVVRNHVNNSNEVLVQDARNRIHLLGSSGKLLWTRQLDGPIMGSATQVDRFRNGKLQLLLNTATSIYLIDRNGKDVGGFPVALKQAATAPLAVFDYDNERDYRVLVPTADGRVLNYGLDGVPTKGWEIPQLPFAARTPVKHLRIKNKDHLLVIGGNGKVKVLDRRGVQRESSSLDLGPAHHVLSVDAGMELMQSRVLWTDSSNAVLEGQLDGSVATLGSGGTGLNALGYMTNDGQYVTARISNDSLMLQHGGKVLFVHAGGTALAPLAGRHAISTGTVWYSAASPGTEQVKLFDNGGTPIEGAPFKGVLIPAIADLDGDGKLELITASADGTVVAYRLPDMGR